VVCLGGAEGVGDALVGGVGLPAIRSKLGFTEVTSARQGRQYERYCRVFRNDNNSTDLVITRRWTALQAPNGVVTHGGTEQKRPA
jgi:hypothetical protein